MIGPQHYIAAANCLATNCAIPSASAQDSTCDDARRSTAKVGDLVDCGRVGTASTRCAAPHVHTACSGHMPHNPGCSAHMPFHETTRQHRCAWQCKEQAQAHSVWPQSKSLNHLPGSNTCCCSKLCTTHTHIHTCMTRMKQPPTNVSAAARAHKHDSKRTQAQAAAAAHACTVLRATCRAPWQT